MSRLACGTTLEDWGILQVPSGQLKAISVFVTLDVT